MDLSKLPSQEELLSLVGIPTGTKLKIPAQIAGISDFGRRIVLKLPDTRDGLTMTVELDWDYVEDLLDERLLGKKNRGKPAKRTTG